MEINKIVFLFLILLFILVLSNYLSNGSEGFAAKKTTRKSTTAPPTPKPTTAAPTPKPTTAPTTPKPTAAPTLKPVTTDALSNNKAITAEINKAIQTAEQHAEKIENLAKNTEKMIKENDALSRKVLEKATALENSIKKIENTETKLNTDMARISKVADANEKNTNSAITQISEKAANVDKSVSANKQIMSDIETKVSGVGKQVDTVKNYADSMIEIKKNVDTTMADFQTNSAVMLKQIQLAIDKFNANQIPTKTPEKFQNMDTSYVVASNAMEKNMIAAKALAFTTIDSAYDGTLYLEGFGTAEESPYLNTNESGKTLFDFEQAVVTALNEFNVEFYKNFKACFIDKDNDNCKISDITSKKNNVNTAVTNLQNAITHMNAKPTATPAADTSNFVDGNGNKITQTEFQNRHNIIKRISENIRNTRSELDAKMAELLDKSKGPLPEAQNNYNFENYTTIGWSVLATSILYYTFVKME